MNVTHINYSSQLLNDVGNPNYDVIPKHLVSNASHPMYY